MQTKACGKCKQNKPLSLFSKKTKSEDGFQPYCKKCCAKMSAKSYRRKQRLLRNAKSEATQRLIREAKAEAKVVIPTSVVPKLPKGALVFIVPLSDAKDIQGWCDQAMRDYLIAKLA